MLATLVLLTAFSATEPTYPVLVVTTHGPLKTEAQVERAASVARARAEHAERLRGAAEVARARAERTAAVLTQAKPSRPAADVEALRLASGLARRG